EITEAHQKGPYKIRFIRFVSSEAAKSEPYRPYLDPELFHQEMIDLELPLFENESVRTNLLRLLKTNVFFASLSVSQQMQKNIHLPEHYAPFHAKVLDQLYAQLDLLSDHFSKKLTVLLAPVINLHVQDSEIFEDISLLEVRDFETQALMA